MPRMILAVESLEELDRLEEDVLVLSLFADERPLRGLNGLADWRLNGRLSAMIVKRELDGTGGERVLTTVNQRFGAARLLLFGLGPFEQFNNMTYARLVERIFTTLEDMKAASCALAIPGANLTDEFILERLAILIKESHAFYRGDVKLFVGRRQNFKEMRAKFDLIHSEVEKLMENTKTKGKKA